MRSVSAKYIQKTVAELCMLANTTLPSDIKNALKKARKIETDRSTKYVLDILIENYLVAQRKKIPICQDTGMAMVYVYLGQDVRIIGDLNLAINKGVAQGYSNGFLRKSVVNCPFVRKNTNTNSPAVINYHVTSGSKIKIIVAPKGFGSENKSVTKMFLPTDVPEKIEDFVVEHIRSVGYDACPPYIVGVGVGGTLDKAVSLSKSALLCSVSVKNPNKYLNQMESRLLKRINSLKIGVMGLGGKTTALAVKVLSYPTHIAGLPVSVSVGCHATRRAMRII